MERDFERDDYLKKQGLKVINIAIWYVLTNIEGTIENLMEYL